MTVDVKIFQGDTWKPRIAVKSVDAFTKMETALNCTSHTAILVIKQNYNESLAVTYTLSVVWISQSGGTGYFTLSNAQSKVISGKYVYEVKLYKDDKTEMYTLAQGTLTIASAIEKDIP